MAQTSRITVLQPQGSTHNHRDQLARKRRPDTYGALVERRPPLLSNASGPAGRLYEYEADVGLEQTGHAVARCMPGMRVSYPRLTDGICFGTFRPIPQGADDVASLPFCRRGGKLRPCQNHL